MFLFLNSQTQKCILVAYPFNAFIHSSEERRAVIIITIIDKVFPTSHCLHCCVADIVVLCVVVDSMSEVVKKILENGSPPKIQFPHSFTFYT